MLCYVAAIVWAVRTVPHNFNESKFIAIAVYNLLFVGVSGALAVWSSSPAPALLTPRLASSPPACSFPAPSAPAAAAQCLMGAMLVTISEVSVSYLLQCIGIFFIVFNTLLILFFPKFYNIYVSREWRRRESMVSYNGRKGRRAPPSSSSPAPSRSEDSVASSFTPPPSVLGGMPSTLEGEQSQVQLAIVDT